MELSNNHCAALEGIESVLGNNGFVPMGILKEAIRRYTGFSANIPELIKDLIQDRYIQTNTDYPRLTEKGRLELKEHRSHPAQLSYSDL